MFGLGFLLLNLPFILWGPSDWLTGVLGPALENLIPAGQGIVSQLASQGLIDLSRPGFAVLLGIVMVSTAVAYFTFFNRLQNLLWILPPFVFFFSYRALHSYFIYWLPLAVLWLDLVTFEPTEERATTNGSAHRKQATSEPS